MDALEGAPAQIGDAPVGRAAFVEAAVCGGYPEALARHGRRRDRWFADYLETTLDRDLSDVSDALKLEAMPRLLRLLAAQAAGLLNYETVADRLQLHPESSARERRRAARRHLDGGACCHRPPTT